MVLDISTKEKEELWFLDKVKAIPYEKDKELEDGLDYVFFWDYPVKVITWNPHHSIVNTCMFELPYILIKGKKSYISKNDYIVTNCDNEYSTFNMDKNNFEQLYFLEEKVKYLKENNIKTLQS